MIYFLKSKSIWRLLWWRKMILRQSWSFEASILRKRWSSKTSIIRRLRRFDRSLSPISSFTRFDFNRFELDFWLFCLFLDFFFLRGFRSKRFALLIDWSIILIYIFFSILFFNFCWLFGFRENKGEKIGFFFYYFFV